MELEIEQRDRSTPFDFDHGPVLFCICHVLQSAGGGGGGSKTHSQLVHTGTNISHRIATITTRTSSGSHSTTAFFMQVASTYKRASRGKVHKRVGDGTTAAASHI